MPAQQKFATDYIDVAARIVEFRTKFPEGSLQPADLTSPYKIESIDGTTYIVVVAAAYRSPEDPRPGIGMAYEIFPGKSNFTRGSELQNAETSAWGRAIVAALAADTKQGIASAEEVRNRREEQERPAPPDPLAALKRQLWAAVQSQGHDDAWLRDDYAQWTQGGVLAEASLADLTKYRDALVPESTRKASRRTA